MTTLLIAEHDNAHLSTETAKALTAASQLGGEVHVLVAGEGCAPVAEAAAQLSGVIGVVASKLCAPISASIRARSSRRRPRTGKA